MGILDTLNLSNKIGGKEQAVIQKLEDRCASDEKGNVVACRLALNMKIGKLRLGQGKALSGGLLSTVGEKMSPQEELVAEEIIEEVEQEM